LTYLSYVVNVLAMAQLRFPEQIRALYGYQFNRSCSVLSLLVLDRR
jgi:hypothetical protein